MNESFQYPANPSFSSGGGASSGTSQTAQQITPGMMDVYSDLLAKNQRNYQNVLSAYQGGQANLAANLPSIYGGYQGVSDQVMQTLGVTGGGWGVAAPAAAAIGQSFAQQQGKTQQDMISRGLGNTTVGANLANQNTLMASQAYGSLGAQLAQTAAGYQSQLGLAGLQARMSGLGMQSAMTQAGMGHLGTQFANTAGSLAGGYGSSAQHAGQQQMGGGGGGGGGFSRPSGLPGDLPGQGGSHPMQWGFSSYPAGEDYSGYGDLVAQANAGYGGTGGGGAAGIDYSGFAAPDAFSAGDFYGGNIDLVE